MGGVRADSSRREKEKLVKRKRWNAGSERVVEEARRRRRVVKSIRAGKRADALRRPIHGSAFAPTSAVSFPAEASVERNHRRHTDPGGFERHVVGHRDSLGQCNALFPHLSLTNASFKGESSESKVRSTLNNTFTGEKCNDPSLARARVRNKTPAQSVERERERVVVNEGQKAQRAIKRYDWREPLLSARRFACHSPGCCTTANFIRRGWLSFSPRRQCFFFSFFSSFPSIGIICGAFVNPVGRRKEDVCVCVCVSPSPPAFPPRSRRTNNGAGGGFARATDSRG